jgi:hypothetical protein
MTMGPSDASATLVGRRPAFQVNGRDDSERLRYAKTVVARGAIYAQKSEPD